MLVHGGYLKSDNKQTGRLVERYDGETPLSIITTELPPPPPFLAKDWLTSYRQHIVENKSMMRVAIYLCFEQW